MSSSDEATPKARGWVRPRLSKLAQRLNRLSLPLLRVLWLAHPLQCPTALAPIQRPASIAQVQRLSCFQCTHVSTRVRTQRPIDGQDLASWRVTWEQRLEESAHFHKLPELNAMPEPCPR
eukprot:3326045-Rhodomonas_salina.1